MTYDPDGTFRSVVAVLPVERTERLIAEGWRAERSNGLTRTVARDYPTPADALAAARKLPRYATWAIEAVRPQGE